MKLIGRSTTQNLAGKRLERVGLWCAEVSSNTWQSFADIKAHFPSAALGRDGVISFPFAGIGICICARVAFKTSVIFILDIVEIPSAQN